MQLNDTLITAIAIFLAGFVIVVAIKARLGEKFTITNAEILLALIPVLLWSFFTGKLKRLDLAGVTIESAFARAADAPVEADVTGLSRLPVEDVPTDPKMGFAELPKLVAKRSEALSFQLGHGGYQGAAIRQYLDVLTQHPYLRYVVLNERDGTFYGLLDARALAQLVRASESGLDPYELANWLNSSEKERLEKIPGFVPARLAIGRTAPRREVLKAMEAANASTLPVVDAAGRFAGVVDRGRLASSLLLDVSKGLER